MREENSFSLPLACQHALTENRDVISGTLTPASCSSVAGRPVKPVKLLELLGFTDFSQQLQAKPQSYKEAFSVKPSAICLKPANHSFIEKKKIYFSFGNIPSPRACSLLVKALAMALREQFSAETCHCRVC